MSFFVWVNYDIEDKEVPLTSLNYLSNYVYEAAGIEMPAYNRFLKDTEGIIPAINAKEYYSVSCNDFLAFDEVS
ncbi:MAG: LTA synthase family protein, partial [Blautia sp.]|nr:LTA synthase family protein [Blautia sp.]